MILRTVALLLLAAGTAVASPLPTLESELQRAMGELTERPEPPYYLSYEVTENDRFRLTASFGNLEADTHDQTRRLDIEVRVGSYQLDNTRPIRGDRRFFRSFPGPAPTLPRDDDPDALAKLLWFHTDRSYKQAVEDFTNVRTNVQVKVEADDLSDDFSPAPAEVYEEPILPVELDREAWADRLERVTATFRDLDQVFDATSSLRAERETRWFVDSEGARIQTSQLRYRLNLRAETKAEDGMDLPRYESWFSRSVDGLPSEAELLAAAARMRDQLVALRTAPLVDPYTGPAILSGRAAGVFFHEVFGHRVESSRFKNADDGQTFKAKINERILPAGFDVLSDPTLERIGDVDLHGTYSFDNQGVRGRPVQVVEDGVFRNFLMSRTPVEGFPTSNGHGRKMPGRRAVSRQSNLVVQADPSVQTDNLEADLIAEVQRQGLPFGLVFEDIQGGFTTTGRTLPNAFNVLPTLVYRLYPDGRKEVVRGVDLIGTPLTAFTKLLKASREPGVFNGSCGAESGWVPVSASSPALLLSQVEVQKKSKSQERPPILPAPEVEDRP